VKDMGLSGLRLQRTAVREGVWEGLLTRVGPGEGPPRIDICHRDVPLGEAEVTARSDTSFTVRVPVPVNSLADGVQTFVLVDRETGLMLDSFAVSLGEPLGGDIRAEMDLLRAELDLLKRAFRRHCAEG